MLFRGHKSAPILNHHNRKELSRSNRALGENIFIFGMGGSILGTKSIYSFLKNRIKKKVFFVVKVFNLSNFFFMKNGSTHGNI